MLVNPAKIDYSGGFPIGFEYFVFVEDPHSDGNKRHHFGEMIFLAVSALVYGVQLCSGIVELAHIHQE